MRRRTLPRILAAGVLVLALAGCVRFQADLTVTPESTVDGEIVVALLLSDDSRESRDAATSGTEQIANELLGNLARHPDVTSEEYEEDDYLGVRLTLDAVPLAAFDGSSEGSLRFAREGDQIVFTGALDFTENAGTDDGSEPSDDGNLAVSVTFPGAVTEHNGDLSGTTVTWSTPLEERLEMSARGSLVPAGPPVLLIAVIAIVAVLVLAAIAVGVFLLVRSSRSTGSPAIAPVTPVGPTVTPAAPVAEPLVTAATPVTDPPVVAAEPPVETTEPPAADVPAVEEPPAKTESSTAAPKKPRAPKKPTTPPTEPTA